MPSKAQAPRRAGIVRFFLHPVGKTIVAVIVTAITLGLILFTYYYVKYSKLIEAKLAAGPFANRPEASGGLATPASVTSSPSSLK